MDTNQFLDAQEYSNVMLLLLKRIKSLGKKTCCRGYDAAHTKNRARK